MLGIKRHSSSEAETFVLWMMKQTSRSKSGSVMLSSCATELRGAFTMKEKYPDYRKTQESLHGKPRRTRPALTRVMLDPDLPVGS